MHQGTLALDIDGTITDERHGLSDEVMLFFETLYQSGWKFVFITGREFVYAMDALSKLNFPFYLAVQNGADLIKMPEREHLKSFYFYENVVASVEKLFEGRQGSFLLYAGYERGDFCYYRPHLFAPELKEYFARMQRISPEPWQEVDHFKIESQKSFSMIKAIGQKEDFLDIEFRLMKEHLLHCVIINDPRSTKYHYLLITDHKASKKEGLAYFFNTYQLPRPLIVAGDDYNDQEALEFGDIRVVMESAPASLKMLGDIIAPPSYKNGIIKGLNEAIDRCRQDRYRRRWV